MIVPSIPFVISRAGGIGYRDLALILRERITSGQLRPGDRMPSETDLANEHGVNRSTVRRAVRELEDEGLIEVHHGYASRVRRPQPTTEVAIQRGATWIVRMPTPAERDEFDLPRGAAVVEVRYGAAIKVYPGDRHTFTTK
jgi:DNA-binding GntR family transcriptional regulator